MRTPFRDLCGQDASIPFPVLLRKPAETLARQALALELSIHDLQTRIEGARSGAQRRPERSGARTRVAQALTTNLSWLLELRSRMLPLVAPSALLTAAVRPELETSSYSALRMFALLRRDWGGTSECEHELQTLLLALRSEMDDAFRPTSRLVVLGSGLGRLADEFAAEYSEVHSVELSFPLALTASLLRQAPISAYDVSTRHARSSDDQARPFVAQRPPHLKNFASRLSVADATDLPFEDGFADIVLSVYFTDVVPPRKLLPEVRRVLRPGGRFIHLGPLGYHFEDADDHLSAEELLAEVSAHGFAVTSPRWVTTTHQCEARSIYECRFHNLLFSADAIDGEVFAPYHLPRPPFI